MDDNYVNCAYDIDFTDPPVETINGPCALRALVVQPWTFGSDVANIKFRDNAADGSILLELDIGFFGSANSTGAQQLFWVFPALGIRFPNSLWIDPSCETSQCDIKSVSIFYTGPRVAIS